MQKEIELDRYSAIVRGEFFRNNWTSNIVSSYKSKEKLVRGRRIVLALRNFKNMPVLNAGSNVGFHTILAKRHGFAVISLDPSREALTAGRLLGWIDESVCGDVMNLPFRENIFSNAIFSEVIEEIPNQPKAILELKRCCVRIIITTSPIRSDVFYGASRIVKGWLKVPKETAHIHEVAPSELLDIFRQSNLLVVSISYYNPFHVWNLASFLPIFKRMDLSPLDLLLGTKVISASLLCVAERPKIPQFG